MERPVKTKGVYPVTLAEAKRHLRVDESWHKDDDYINGLIEAAVQIAEEYCGFDFAVTQNSTKIWDFAGDRIKLYEGGKVTDVSIYTNDPSTVLPIDHIESYWNYSEILLPNTYEGDPLNILYRTGYETLPAKLKTAVLIIVGDLYDMERNSYTNLQNQNTWRRILDSVKINIM